MPNEWLGWAALLHQRAGKLDAMFAAASELAAQPHHPDLPLALLALSDTTQEAEKNAQFAEMAQVFDRVPATSDLQPRAAEDDARLLMWRMGDFAKAVQVLQPMVSKGDDNLKRLYGQALVLSGKAQEGRKLLEQLPVTGKINRQAAMSGAEARTIEFYITQKEPEAGERTWERWQQQYPADFLQGYSVVLKTRLIELQKAPLAAAKLAEAFAQAVPNSSYAPQLLDKASKLIASSDAGKSAQLRKLLKERYPEDPLSQQ
jgi:hypothetical protein